MIPTHCNILSSR